MKSTSTLMKDRKYPALVHGNLFLIFCEPTESGSTYKKISLFCGRVLPNLVVLQDGDDEGFEDNASDVY